MTAEVYNWSLSAFMLLVFICFVGVFLCDFIFFSQCQVLGQSCQGCAFLSSFFVCVAGLFFIFFIILGLYILHQILNPIHISYSFLVSRCKILYLPIR